MTPRLESILTSSRCAFELSHSDSVYVQSLVWTALGGGGSALSSGTARIYAQLAEDHPSLTQAILFPILQRIHHEYLEDGKLSDAEPLPAIWLELLASFGLKIVPLPLDGKVPGRFYRLEFQEEKGLLNLSRLLKDPSFLIFLNQFATIRSFSYQDDYSAMVINKLKTYEYLPPTFPVSRSLDQSYSIKDLEGLCRWFPAGISASYGYQRIFGTWLETITSPSILSQPAASQFKVQKLNSHGVVLHLKEMIFGFSAALDEAIERENYSERGKRPDVPEEMASLFFENRFLQMKNIAQNYGEGELDLKHLTLIRLLNLRLVSSGKPFYPESF